MKTEPAGKNPPAGFAIPYRGTWAPPTNAVFVPQVLIYFVRYYRREVVFFCVVVVAADATVVVVFLGDRTVVHQLLSTACLVWSASTGAVAFTHKFWQVS